MLIAQISDIHMAEKGTKTFGVVCMAEKLLACIHSVNHYNPPIDLAMITGDIANTGKPGEVKYARELLNRLNVPYYVIPGNHDDPKLLQSEFDLAVYPASLFNGTDYVIEKNGVLIVAMDTVKSGEAGGELTASQIRWLDDILNRHSSLPTIIFMHHLPVSVGVIEVDTYGFSGKVELGSVVAKHGQIEKIACGHVHLPINVRWNGTVVASAPSIGMRLVYDLNLTKVSRFAVDPAQYQLHYFTKEKYLVTHNVVAEPSDKSYSFENC